MHVTQMVHHRQHMLDAILTAQENSHGFKILTRLEHKPIILINSSHRRRMTSEVAVTSRRELLWPLQHVADCSAYHTKTPATKVMTPILRLPPCLSTELRRRTWIRSGWDNWSGSHRDPVICCQITSRPHNRDPAREKTAIDALRRTCVSSAESGENLKPPRRHKGYVPHTEHLRKALMVLEHDHTAESCFHRTK